MELDKDIAKQGHQYCIRGLALVGTGIILRRDRNAGYPPRKQEIRSESLSGRRGQAGLSPWVRLANIRLLASPYPGGQRAREDTAGTTVSKEKVLEYNAKPKPGQFTQFHAVERGIAAFVGWRPGGIGPKIPPWEDKGGCQLPRAVDRISLSIGLCRPSGTDLLFWPCLIAVRLALMDPASWVDI